MQVSVQQGPLWEISADWLVAGVWQDEPPAGALAQLNDKLDGLLVRLGQASDLTGKANEVTPLYHLPGIGARRLLLVGLGKRGSCDCIRLHQAAAVAARSITDKQHNRLAFALPEGCPDLGMGEVARAAVAGLMQGSHGPGIRKAKPERFAPEEIVLVAPAATPREDIQRGAERGRIEGQAVELARELVNQPPCDLYPETFAQRAREAASRLPNLECSILDEHQLEAERMGSLLAVARGSDRPPRMVVLRYRGAGDGRWLGLVGKGVTFDSGGLSLKTNEQMLDMKCDMAGAAAVLAAMTAIAELGWKANVLGILAIVENLPGGKAMKLGDVLHARNGKTIEVLNTDAEGRLILADALAYAVDHQASNLVDLATLTGACMVALGEDVAGLMANDETWSSRVQNAARQAGERLWPLPMFPLYGDMLKSNVADLKNVTGKRYAGAITAAKFLENFVAGVPWAHLDIAGPAWADHDAPDHDPGGTGFGVRTLVELARGYSG